MVSPAGPSSMAPSMVSPPEIESVKHNEAKFNRNSPGTSKIATTPSSPPRKASWASAVVETPISIGQIHTDFTVSNGVAEITIPENVLWEAEPLWKSFVAGYFMGDAPHVGTIHTTVNRIWSNLEKYSKINVQFKNKTTVLFRIESSRIRERVVKRRYWHIGDIPLVLNEWNPETT